jgi:hypothetical protein
VKIFASPLCVASEGWVKRWRASGSPAHEFAAAHGLRKSQLYDWSFRLRAVPAIEADASSSTFTELRVREDITADARTMDRAPHPNDPAAQRRYEPRYAWYAVRNILELRHAAAGGSFTR